MSSAETSEAPLSILVKSPTDAPGTPDLALEFPRTAKVQDVKMALESAHPRHPSPSSQRLIHAGKLLQDNAALVDVLTGTTPQVVHLVTPPTQAPTTATPAAASPLTTEQPPATPTTDIPASHIQEVEDAFQRVVHHQQRYLRLVRGAANPQETAAELDAVRAAVANYDACVQRQRNPVQPVADAAAGLGPGPQFMMADNAGAVAGGAVPPNNQGPLPPQWAGQQAWINGAPMFPGPGAPRQGQVVRRAMVFQFDLHWGLLLKLGVFVFILAQEGSPRRTKLLAAVALMVYLWHTGHLGFVRRLLGVLLPSPAQLFTYLSESSQNDGDVTQTEGIRTVSTTYRLMVFLSYVYSFLYGFVCSLLPSWDPEPLPQDVMAGGRPREAAQAHEHAE